MTRTAFGSKPYHKLSLFNLVRNLFEQQPGALIPEDDWEQKLSDYRIERDSELWVNSGKFEIKCFNPDMIQVLAAISLGEPTSRIAALMEHLQCSVDDIIDGALRSVAVENDENYETSKYLPLSLLRVTLECAKALHQIPSQAPKLKTLRILGKTNPTITMALLSLDDPDLWHGTHISDYFKAFYAGDLNLPEKPRELRFDEFNLGISDGYQHSDEQIRELMKRAGLLIRDACSENSFTESFYVDALSKASKKYMPETDAQAIMKAINRATDPSEKRAFTDKLTRALNTQTLLDADEIVQASRVLGCIDPVAYSDVVNSKIVKINMMVGPAKDEMSYAAITQVDQGTLFADLASDFLKISIDDFGTHHFRALSKFANEWPGAHGTPPEDINSFVRHALLGLERFLATPIVWKGGSVKDNAINRTATFLTVASRVAEPNYELLNELGSESKALMSMNGYKIQRFTGMSQKDKGRVLCDDLGM